LHGFVASALSDEFWEFELVPGRVVRLLFECRSYKRRINQQALHS
jgi:hypothetical protein